MFYRLRKDKATFMMSMLELEGLPTLLVIRHGRVVDSIGPKALRKMPVAKAVAKLGILDADEDMPHSDDESEDEEERPHRSRSWRRIGRS